MLVLRRGDTVLPKRGSAMKRLAIIATIAGLSACATPGIDYQAHLDGRAPGGARCLFGAPGARVQALSRAPAAWRRR